MGIAGRARPVVFRAVEKDGRHRDRCPEGASPDERLLGEIAISLETEDIPRPGKTWKKPSRRCTQRSRARAGRTLSGTWTTRFPMHTG